MAFENEIRKYEELRQRYQSLIINKMDREEYIKYNEVLFSTHSCAIEGNSFSVDDTRELKEKGLGMIPAGKTLFEAFEMLDHFEAYEYMIHRERLKARKGKVIKIWKDDRFNYITLEFDEEDVK